MYSYTIFDFEIFFTDFSIRGFDIREIDDYILKFYRFCKQTLPQSQYYLLCI